MMSTDLIENCPFVFDITQADANQCVEEAKPLKTLEDVGRFVVLLREGKLPKWIKHTKALEPATEFCYDGGEVQNTIQWLPRKRIQRSSVPKTLLCHDYKGGYLEDRLINGSRNEEAYVFYNWSWVDVFVYFSHHFVTIPPPGWINAGHLHGVPVLGTLITEWKDGEDLWDRVLDSEQKITWLADVLAVIAATYLFDGYLVNIENKLSAKQVPQMLLFLQTLKRRLALRVFTTSYVIWYDAVTVEGELKWQNELNELNKAFFDVCHGIFVNYTWSEQHLQRTQITAGERLHDVYMGVDVFGRNFYEGGGFRTDRALKIIRNYGLSAAVFAFGWTKEAIPGEFHINDDLFWTSLEPYMYLHGTTSFPFLSDFCRGAGLEYYKHGVAYVQSTWYDLSKQSLQHQRHRNLNNKAVEERIIKTISDINVVKKSNEEPERGMNAMSLLKLKQLLDRLYLELQPTVVEYTTAGAYMGGGALIITGELLQDVRQYLTLFICDLKVEKSFTVEVATKETGLTQRHSQPDDKQLEPALYLIIVEPDGRVKKVELPVTVNISSAEWNLRKHMVHDVGRVLEVGLVAHSTDPAYLLGQISIRY